MKSLPIFWILSTLITCLVHGDTDYELYRLEICRDQYQSCEAAQENGYCSCDDMCILYDNCCLDASSIAEKREEVMIDATRRDYLQSATCGAITISEEALVLTRGVFMVSSCPRSWTRDIGTKQSCEHSVDDDVRDILPVVDISTEFTFKNRHCAKCHGVHNYRPWLLEILCSNEMLPPSMSIIEEVMTKIHSQHCIYRFVMPQDTKVHICYHQFNYTIISNISGAVNNDSACRNRVFSPLIVRLNKHVTRYYRNLQCLIGDEGPGYEKVLEYTYCAMYAVNTKHRYLSLSALFDFSTLFQGRMNHCKDDEIRLSNEAGCHRLYCPAGSEPSGGECVAIQFTSTGVFLDLLFEVNKASKDGMLLKDTIDKFIMVFRNNTYSNTGYGIVDLRRDSAIPGIQEITGETCCAIPLRIRLLEITIANERLDYERSWTAEYFKNLVVERSDGSVIKHVTHVEQISCRTNASIYNPTFLRKMVKVDNDLPCPAVKLQYSGNMSDREESVIRNVSHSYYHLRGRIISPSDVVFANGHYFACINTFLSNDKVPTEQYSTMGIYIDHINTAGASISIICMIYFLLQYSVVPIFRDGKSDLLVVLILFLLLAQICFFLFSHLEIPSNVCEWLGSIHHFAWLTSFVFMFLCLFRFNKEIRDLRTYSKSERLDVTVKYILVGISLSALVSIGIKVIESALASTEKWYGGRLCFLTQTFVIVLGFVVPITLILCGNVILFISIIRYVTSTSNSADSNKSNMLIYIKISTIMGFSWMLGFIAMLLQSGVLLMVFEVLSNLQGTFITISFSCSTRVRRFYKECFQRVKRRESPETGNELNTFEINRQ